MSIRQRSRPVSTALRGAVHESSESNARLRPAIAVGKRWGSVLAVAAMVSVVTVPAAHGHPPPAGGPPAVVAPLLGAGDTAPAAAALRSAMAQDIMLQVLSTPSDLLDTTFGTGGVVTTNVATESLVTRAQMAAFISRAITHAGSR